MTLPRRLELPIDIGGLIVALVVDIVMNVVCFATLAPDLVTRIAFISIGIMIVLFVPRSWSKRQFVAWAVFASVVFFFDYSFALVATKAQTAHTTVNVFADPEVVRLDGEITKHDARIEELTRQYGDAAKRETMDQLDAQIKDEKSARLVAETDRKARIREVTRTSERSGITSAEIFTAIPDAARDGRIIQLVIFGLIFIGLQLIIATSIDNGVKLPVVAPAPVAPPVDAPAPAPIDPVVITPEDVDKYVEWTWFRVKQKSDTHALPRETLIAHLKRIDQSIDESVYDVINQEAHESGIINADDVIRVTDDALAARRLKELLCK